MESKIMERPSFLVCGLPRTRTLWLSHFFTLPGICECEHEAIQYAASSDEFWQRADSCSEPVWGNCDSAQIMVLPALLAARPMTKVVWIERPIAEVIKSLKKAGFPVSNAAMELLIGHRNKYRELFDTVIDYHRLGELPVIMCLWRFLLGDVPFDYGRWGMMEACKVAYTFQEYLDHPRGDKFLRFINSEGEIRSNAR